LPETVSLKRKTSLGDVADLPAEVLEVELTEIDPVYEDLSLVGVVHAEEELGDGGLAAAGPADDDDLLPFADLQIKIDDCVYTRIGIRKIYALEADVSL